jgi:diguanylate cyclase (GGDEF)-like protein
MNEGPSSGFVKTNPDVRRGPRGLAGVWRWLIEPAVTRSEPERRRARVLATLTLTLAISAALFLAFVFIGPDEELRLPYAILIWVLLAVFLLAFRLNHAGRYTAAAGLIVGCTVVGPWASILLNLTALGSDVMRLTYIAVSVLLSSFLLPIRVTVLLATSQFALLVGLSLFFPVLPNTAWSSVLGFVLFVSALSVVSNYVSRRDMEQIDQQTQQLRESEARLLELSVRDPLTGLFNRRYLEETLEREFNRAARKNLSLGVVMLDIDQFKRFNDAHGHAAGDAVLKAISEVLRGQVRGSDIACRYGGEEFMLIMPEAGLDAARERAERLRVAAKGLHAQFEGRRLEAVTLSLGVAAFPENGSTAAEVLKAADAALYRAKQAGRDRVVAAA